jgi:enoyl-CoA hydratase/carnithine racemase
MTASPDDVLLVDRDGPVAVVTLNRPDQLNAFDDELLYVTALLHDIGLTGVASLRWCK